MIPMKFDINSTFSVHFAILVAIDAVEQGKPIILL